MNSKTRLALALVPLISFGCSSQSIKVEAPITTLSNADSAGEALAISNASDRLVSGNWAGKIKVWDLPRGQAQKAWTAHSESVSGVAYGREDKVVISAGYDGKIAVWTNEGKPVKNWHGGSPITAFAMGPERNEIATGHKDGWVRHWRIRDNALLRERKIRQSAIRSLSISEDGKTIAIGSDSAHTSVWQPTKNLLKHFQQSPSYSRALAFSPDGKSLYGSGWFNIFRWQLSDGKLDVIPTDHAGIINSIQFTPSGRLASISRQTDSAVLVLDPKNGNTVSSFQKHNLCGGQIAVSPDGCFMATNSDDASVRIWALNAQCGLPKQELYGSR